MCISEGKNLQYKQPGHLNSSPANIRRVLNYQQASIAYFGGRHIMPDGTYDLSFTLKDALGKEYPPVVHRRIIVDTSTGVPSKQSGDIPTSCPSPEPGAHPICTSTADCNGFPCTDLGCVCSEDWFGVDCRGDIHDTSAYIPQADPGVDPLTCAQVVKKSPVALALAFEISNLAKTATP